MVTKVNDTVLDLNSPVVSSGQFQSLSVLDAPVNPNDVVPLSYAESNFLTSAGGQIRNSELTFFSSGFGQDVITLNAGNGSSSVGPDIGFAGDGYTNCGDNMYIGFDANDAGGTLQFVRGGSTVPSSEVVGEFGDGWLRITRPDQPGSPDDPVYLLLDQQPSGTPAPGAQFGASVIFHSPDQTAQGHAYPYSRWVHIDGTIMTLRAGTALDGTGDVDIMTVVQAATPWFNFHNHPLKNILDPVAAQDAATMNYVDTAVAVNGIDPGTTLADPGYIRWGNGFVIQWATVPPVGPGPTVIPFPWAFTGAPFVVLANSQFAGTMAAAHTFTGASFTVDVFDTAGLPAVAPISWVAIGII